MCMFVITKSHTMKLTAVNEIETIGSNIERTNRLIIYASVILIGLFIGIGFALTSVLGS